MNEQRLNAEEQAEADRIKAVVMERAAEEVGKMIGMLASKETPEFFGRTEFELRDLCHRIGAMTMQAALDERKKGGTEVPAPVVRSAAKTPGSSPIGPRR